VERTRGAVLTLQARGQKVTADSLKQASRELEPGFAGLSFQVIRRNPAAYALYREAADAFAAPARERPTAKRKKRRAETRAGRRVPRAA
jgi:4'-phosphopantetheinyl transferase EntD